MQRDYLTVEEWEGRLGAQIRTARVAAKLDQASLAKLANVSVDALSRLERGKGSSLKTLVGAVRALGRTEWLETLAPNIVVSPMQMLKAKGAHDPRNRRVRHPRPS